MSFVSAPVEMYEVVLREFDWANAREGDDPHYWEVSDIRLAGRSVKSDWGQYGWPLSWCRTREQALEAGERLCQWHRDHHVWWTPIRS